MTARLYQNDPYLREFSSEVIEETALNSKPRAILKQTAFYPASGGQPHDTGTLNNVSVVEVIEDQSQQIVHLLEAPLKTSRVAGQINWQRRFDHMQQHTGQHILSQAFMKTVYIDTVACGIFESV
jgi:alanyl-tRNA synthetase